MLVISEDPRMDVPDNHQHLVDLLQRIYIDNTSIMKPEITHYEDANWVSYRLAELLPVKNEFKQQLLELTGAIDRLEMISKVISNLSK